jgi:Ca2+-binding EF-hand superfamily protein
VKKSKDTGSYEDFIECLKLYDKMENGTMMLGELEHILLSLGEKLGKLIIKGTLPPHTDKKREKKISSYIRKYRREWGCKVMYD